MNIKKVVKYQIIDNRRAILIFYLVVVCVIAMFSVSIFRSDLGGSVRIGGFEMAAVVFLFIAGLNSFRETFRMMIQNGVSRRSTFKGFLITTVILSASMSLINLIILWMMKAFEVPDNAEFEFSGLFEQMYAQRYVGNSSNIQEMVEGLLFLICITAAAMMLGYFITIMYYRLNKAGKVAVSVGVPAIMIIGLPVFDAAVTGGQIQVALGRLFLFAGGFLNGHNPYYGIVSSLICFALLAALSWLLMRRAVIKD